MYIIKTEQSFDSAHFLSGYKGKCSNIHGHRWKVVARIAAQNLEKGDQMRDMVLDFGDFKEALKSLTEPLDHSLIYETGSLKESTVKALLDEGFSLNEMPFRPTAEQFSRYFYDKLRELSMPVYDVTVYETPTNSSTYTEASL
ncbi:MAG: 6-carboxytetrahydropterin synthase [Eubacterium sp.]|nr:6-carboxytetrahydropterin synthase [Eubacterium sp.]MDD7208529.1 6-carboxytetrahydropterin synthase [Lachnospiraceae bacterium]MDY5498180.1 6-carboxytetrahydropterin synthase [Anaerobutyricum sp.]